MAAIRDFLRFCLPIATPLVVSTLAACDRGPARIEPGVYRAVLTLPGGELPFGLELAEDGGRPVAYLVNGAERVRVAEITLEGRKLDMRMPGFGNRLSARLKDGRLVGEVVLVNTGGEEQRIPLIATRGETYRFFKEAHTDNADVSGRWAVTFTATDGTSESAIGEFTQKFDQVTGTFLAPSGDHRYLAGEVRDDELFLSSFDGGRAFLYKAKRTPSGALAGTWWSGLASRDDFIARRDDAAALADPSSITRIRDQVWTLGFMFPDQGGQLISLADARYRGKALVVVLAGSWCPNSHDAQGFLSDIDRRQRARGLEVIELMFEHSADFETAAAAVRSFRTKFAIEHATLIAGISDKKDAAEKLPQLNGVYAFPTLLFIDRKGRVRRIHTGFAGPATGAHHEELTRSLMATVGELLAEPGV
jgi:hypothetical protein